MADNTADRPAYAKKIEVTPEMIEAAEKALFDHAEQYNIRSLDELHHDTVRLMIEAAISRIRAA
jgi:hypothetical protein